MQGRFKALESRFWNKLEFVPAAALADLWKARREIEFNSLGVGRRRDMSADAGRVACSPAWRALRRGRTTRRRCVGE
jgi:hypothetical protein